MEAVDVSLVANLKIERVSSVFRSVCTLHCAPEAHYNLMNL
jgi:hypothetical protein